MEHDPSFLSWLDAQAAKLRNLRSDRSERDTSDVNKKVHHYKVDSRRYRQFAEHLLSWVANNQVPSDDELIDLASGDETGLGSEDEMELNTNSPGARSSTDRDFYKVVWNEGDTARESREPTAREQVAKILKETDAGYSDNDRAKALASVSAESGFVDALNAQYSAESAPQRNMEADLDWAMETNSVDGAEDDQGSVQSDDMAVRIRGLPNHRPQRSPPPPELDERPLDNEEIDMFMEEMDRIANVYQPGKAKTRAPIFTGKGSYRKMDSKQMTSVEDEPADMSQREPIERDTMPIVDQESLRVRAKERRRQIKIGLAVGGIVVLVIAFSVTTYFIVKALQS